MDLALANEAGLNHKPIYSKLYDSKIDLEINSLFARDFDTVVKKMAVDDEYYEKYFRYVVVISKYWFFQLTCKVYYINKGK